MEKYWFKRKRYGWGWYPSSWQGWSVLGIYLLSILAAAFNANMFTGTSPDVLFSFIPEVLFYTIILISICYKTGETPKWQWGARK